MPENAVDFHLLYKIMYELTVVFESSKTPNELILGLKQVFKRFFEIKEVEIFSVDENSNCLKNFVKPWENLPDGASCNFLHDVFLQLKENKPYVINGDEIFVPVFSQDKVTGVVKLQGNVQKEEFFSFLPLLSRQISLAVVHLKYFETVINSAKFYETIRNIAKITETQYDLSYILPIMGEIIDGFIKEHLIYIFLKSTHKNEYKLIWPNKCLINNISDYLSKIADSNYLVFDEGKTCIFPLVSKGKISGAVVAYNTIDSLNKSEVKYLEQLAIQASITVDKAKEYMKTLENATLDAMTGLNNRHMFYQRLAETTSNARRQKTNLCCIMTDIDFFKSVNDTYGHAAGDLALKTVAKTIKKELREYDIASRYGGEEFAILLPDTSPDEAYKVAERLRKQVEKKKINIEELKIEGVKEISVTISIGVSLYIPDKMKDPNDLYKSADKGLYIAKESGRNRVVVSD